MTTVADLDTFRRGVRAFVAEHNPGPKSHTGSRAPAPEMMPAIRAWTAKLFDEGLLGIDWPVRFGGRPEAHPLEPHVVVEEITRARTWLPLGAFPLAAAAILDYGTVEQQERLLPRIRDCSDIWCQLFSEPGAGSDLAGLSTRAVRDGDEYVVDGQKVWTTNGHVADRGFLLARTDPGSSRHRGITAFALDMTAPGVHVRPLREITGTTDFNEVFLDGARIPVRDVIGEPGQGWAVAMSSLGRERSGVAAHGAQLYAALDDLVGLARDSVAASGLPALQDPALRQRIGEIATRVHVNASLVAVAQSRMVAGTVDTADPMIGKIFFSEVNHDLAELGVALQGVDGVLTEVDPDVRAAGWWQDAYLYARAYTIAGGANEVLRTQIAERGLGLPREPRP